MGFDQYPIAKRTQPVPPRARPAPAQARAHQKGTDERAGVARLLCTMIPWYRIDGRESEISPHSPVCPDRTANCTFSRGWAKIANYVPMRLSAGWEPRGCCFSYWVG